MRHEVTWTPAANRSFKRLPRGVKNDILATIADLAENPFADHLNIKKMKGYKDGRMRARPKGAANNHRVVYRVVKNEVIIEIIEIRQRGDKTYK